MLTQEPIMLLNYPIGSGSVDDGEFYVDGALFQRELLELDGMGFKRIQLYINCPGGNVVEGYNICNAILKSKTPVDTYNVGLAASMAGAIFMMGRQRIMADYSILMIHNPFNPEGGGDKNQLESMRKSMVTMIASKSNLKDDEIAYLCNRETYLGSAECFQKGFCTSVEVTKESNRKGMPLGTQAMWKEANLIQSNLFNNKITMSTENAAPALQAKIGISLIASYLGLNTEATEASVLNEVKNKINTEILARTKAEDRIVEMQKAFDKISAELVEAKKKYQDTVDAAAQAKVEADKIAAEEKVKAEASAKEVLKTAAKTMVATFVGKKIKTEEAAKWEATAEKIGVDEAKALIENLPLNATAASAQAAAKNTGDDVKPLETTATAMMAKIQAATKKRIA